jgi:peptidoglycan biosynthesis protein MviN/MurJ (putative lipid II flippase)
MIISAALFVVCSMVGAVTGGAFGTMCGAAVAQWMGAVLFWWQLRKALRVEQPTRAPRIEQPART